MDKNTQRRTALALALASALAATAGMAAAPEFRITQNPVQGQYIVVLKENVAVLANERGQGIAVADIARQIGGQHGARVRRSFTHALRGFVVQADDRALARLLADDRIAYVEEDGYVSINATQSPATWGLDRVDQRDLPLSNSYTYNTTATSVHAYIIDTGVLLNHVEFSGRMGNGFDAVTSGGSGNDCNGHGTHVAGTVGGTTWGVAKGVIIHPVRVLGCSGSGTNSGVIAGMDWVTANHIKPAVANMSLGGGASQATDDAVARMTNAGVTVAVAAGNSNNDACGSSPARAPSAITVGSTTSSDARSSFSSFGSCLDIWAPGSSITSAWFTSSTATNTISGTSMASPHVAGVAALYLADNPTATPAAVTAALNNAATPNKVTNPGAGSPNRLLYSVFGAPPPADTTAPSVPASLGATAASSSQINLSWSASIDTGGSGLAGYRIERCAGAGCSNFAEIGNTTGTSFSNTGLTASTSYSYRIRAFDGAGNNSGYSNTASATTAASGGGAQTYTNAADFQIRDNSTINSTIVVSGRSGNASSTSTVRVDIKHTYIGDLKVDLIAPDGTVYVLHNRTGAGTDNLNTTYTRNLSSEVLNGTWTLRVNDNANLDTGFLDSWSLTF